MDFASNNLRFTKNERYHGACITDGLLKFDCSLIDGKFEDYKEILIGVSISKERIGLGVSYKQSAHVQYEHEETTTEGFWMKFIDFPTSMEDLYEFLDFDDNEVKTDWYNKEQRRDLKPLFHDNRDMFESLVDVINFALRTMWSTEESTKLYQFINDDLLLVRQLNEEIYNDNVDRIRFLCQQSFGVLVGSTFEYLPKGIIYSMLNGEIIELSATSRHVKIPSEFREVSEGIFEELDGCPQWITFFNDTKHIYSVEENGSTADETMAEAWRKDKLDLGLQCIKTNGKIPKEQLIGKPYTDFVF